MTNKSLQFAIATATGILITSTAAFATNGMLMEGYGPESTAMGGAGAAINNGAAGMVNNPATIGMIEDGSARLDISIGNLRPNVRTKVITPQGTVSAESGGDSYLLPAMGYIRRSGKITYGAGIFAQGGMGTEYEDTSPLMGARSEVSVGSLLAPIAYQVNEKFTIGGTLQYVWGGMDLIMGMPLFAPDGSPAPGTFADFSAAFGGSNILGSASGSLLEGFGQLLATLPQDQLPNHAAVFDFSNDSDYTGQTTGAGMGGKIGMTYVMSPQATMGITYQAKTSMADWKGNGKMRVVNTTDGSVVAEFAGKYTVKDFQFPSSLTVGFAVKPTEKVTLLLDFSRINWSDSMSTFDLNFTANEASGGAAADITLNQKWDDQTVFKFGTAIQTTKNLILRFGANFANNPVPDEYMNPLFPAIVTNHYTTGFSYNIGAGNSVIGASLVVAPSVKQTNSNTGITSKHAQSNVQVMYSHKF